MNCNEYKQQVDCSVEGGTIKTISQEKLLNHYILFPPPEQQNQIEEFLKQQTTQFDELIAKSKKQITLLAEKRQATINQAVTKGLDPSVPMKDSGVEWIGEIPEGWREPTISNLKHMNVIIDFQDGNHGELHPKGDDFSSEGRPFLTANQIDEFGKVDLKNCNKLPEEFCKKLRIGFSQANDVLFCHNATVGRVGVMPNDAPNSIVGTSITYYRINNEKINHRFFAYLLGSDYISSQYEPIMKQSTRNQFSIQKQAKLRILFPTKEEQIQIAEFLEKQTTQFDELIAKSKAQITLLEEKRQALITETVTGKIDVRSEVVA